MFGILGSRCLTGSALLDCHVLKGFGIYMIGTLDSSSGVLKPIVVVVVFFTLTDRASTIPSKTRGCQSGTWSAGQKKKSEEHLPSSNESKAKHKHTNDKEIGTGITKYTGQRKINERHSIERVWHSAGREPSDTLPGSQPCTQKTRSIYHIPYSKGFSFTNGTIDVA